MKIPFDIKFRPQIESGEYKLSFDGKPARIICWDRKRSRGNATLVALIDDGESEHTEYFFSDGLAICATAPALYIITPEPELSEFEKAVGLELFDEPFGEKHIKVIKEESAKLLSLARKELEPKIKAEALRTRATELTKNLTKSGLDTDSIPYHLIEFMCNLYTCQNWKEIEETAELYITRIKAAAMKDLPRWKKAVASFGNYSVAPTETGKLCLLIDGYYIMLSDLKKLTGFNE